MCHLQDRSPGQPLSPLAVLASSARSEKEGKKDVTWPVDSATVKETRREEEEGKKKSE